MPYIKPATRPLLDLRIESLAAGVLDEGELNYAISRLVSLWIDTPRYSAINAAIGVLECAKLELYRRLAAPYEDIKIAENGDIQEYTNAPEATPASRVQDASQDHGPAAPGQADPAR
jgi:hypothetical protein